MTYIEYRAIYDALTTRAVNSGTTEERLCLVELQTALYGYWHVYYDAAVQFSNGEVCGTYPTVLLNTSGSPSRMAEPPAVLRT
jgi:hypothetical protein